MKAWVYKSSKQEQTYLYVGRENCFDSVPEGLITLLGDLEFVLSVELHEDRKLAQVDARDVMERLQENGYFLQMPPPKNSFVRPC